MNLIQTEFEGLYIIQNHRLFDDRGFFEKKYDHTLGKLLEHAHEVYISQSKKNVLRGLHFQRGKNAQSKLISCLRGSFLDIAVDLRPNQATYTKCFIHKLSGSEDQSIFIPPEFAHGIYSTEENTILMNMTGNLYSPLDECGICWSSITELNHIKNPIVSMKDLNLPSLDEIKQRLANEKSTFTW